MLYKKPTWGHGPLPFNQCFVRRSQQVDITMNAAMALETLICTSEPVFHQPAHQVGVTVQLPAATGHHIELEMAVKQGHH